MGHYSIPTVIERSRGVERAMDIYSRLLSERVIYLGTEIDDDVANIVVAQLLYLDSETQDQDIALYVNSPGGSISATMAIYDTMQFVHAPLSTTCVGQAAGGAAVLLAAGSAGRRSVLPHTSVLLQQPSLGGQGTISDLLLRAEEAARIRDQMIEVLAAHTGQTVDTLHADTARDKIFGAEAAVHYGLVDRVIRSTKIPVPPARN